MELYGVDLKKFSKECQHGVAASTTINDIPNAQNRQVQIQGSQVPFVYKLLIGKYLHIKNNVKSSMLIINMFSINIYN